MEGRRQVRGAVLFILCLAACAPDGERSRFPEVERKVASINEGNAETEDARERMGEAEAVLDFAKVDEGMTVADIGAGQGYYVGHLARAVGPRGRVLAEDITPAVRDQLAQRVQRERLDNVAVVLGTPVDPRLPDASFDRVFMIHVYHEVEKPYELMWRLAGALKAGGRLVIVEGDRPIHRHGMPFDLLVCELEAVGFVQEIREPILGSDSYAAMFRMEGSRPAPQDIVPCDLDTDDV
jgi:ubiquinone/menaquinone biosynthesis C-methylase UbiE